MSATVWISSNFENNEKSWKNEWNECSKKGTKTKVIANKSLQGFFAVTNVVVVFSIQKHTTNCCFITMYSFGKIFPLF